MLVHYQSLPQCLLQYLHVPQSPLLLSRVSFSLIFLNMTSIRTRVRSRMLTNMPLMMSRLLMLMIRARCTGCIWGGEAVRGIRPSFRSRSRLMSGSWLTSIQLILFWYMATLCAACLSSGSLKNIAYTLSFTVLVISCMIHPNYISRIQAHVQNKCQAEEVRQVVFLERSRKKHFALKIRYFC